MIFCRKCGRYYPDGTPSCIVCNADLAEFGHVTHRGATAQREPVGTAVRTAPARTEVKAVGFGAAVKLAPIASTVAVAPPENSPSIAPPAADNKTDPAFDRDRFLLRQKALAIKEKYYVTDDQGSPLMFVERPALLAQQILMLAGVALTFFGGNMLMSYLADPVRTMVGEDFGRIFPIVGLLAVIAATVSVFVLLVPKRHVTFYKDDSKTERVLEIRQLNKIEFPYANFTILDTAGNRIGSLRKNVLFNYIRRRWQVRNANGHELCMAKEDSIVLSLLRRTGIPLFLFMRTNFIFLRGKDVVGEFNRKFTLLDRYVLDLTADSQRRIDRRIALALGVMLDTGERR